MTNRPDGAKTTIGKLVSFAIAGGSGMVADLGVLRFMLEMFDITPFAARIPAIAAAMLTTWFINRHYTFGASNGSVKSEGARYFSVALVGAVLNYIIFSAILIIAPGRFLPELATIIAVGVVTIFSYFGYSRFVFKK